MPECKQKMTTKNQKTLSAESKHRVTSHRPERRPAISHKGARTQNVNGQLTHKAMLLTIQTMSHSNHCSIPKSNTVRPPHTFPFTARHRIQINGTKLNCRHHMNPAPTLSLSLSLSRIVVLLHGNEPI